MTLKIEATIPQDEVSSGNGGAYLSKALSAIGFFRSDTIRHFGSHTHDGEPVTEGPPNTTKPDDKPKTTRASTKKADKAAISTGEERVGPEDSAATQQQDAADEKREADQKKAGLTLDDVRAAVGRYTAKYGMKTAAADVARLLGCKMPDLPETEEALSAAIAKIDAAIERGIVAPEAPVETTKADVIAAMKRYGAKYDGESEDPSKMKRTAADVSLIFQGLFGSDVQGISKVPASPENYARCVAAIDEAVEANPYDREVLG